MKRKVLVYLFTGLLTVGLLAGCGKKTTEELPEIGTSEVSSIEESESIEVLDGGTDAFTESEVDTESVETEEVSLESVEELVSDVEDTSVVSEDEITVEILEDAINNYYKKFDSGNFSIGSYIGEIDPSKAVAEFGIDSNNGLAFTSIFGIKIYADKKNNLIYYFDANEKQWFKAAVSSDEAKSVFESLDSENNETNMLEEYNVLGDATDKEYMGIKTLNSCEYYVLKAKLDDTEEDSEYSFYVDKNTMDLYAISVEESLATIYVTMSNKPLVIPDEVLQAPDGDYEKYQQEALGSMFSNISIDSDDSEE